MNIFFFGLFMCKDIHSKASSIMYLFLLIDPPEGCQDIIC